MGREGLQITDERFCVKWGRGLCDSSGGELEVKGLRVRLVSRGGHPAARPAE